MSKKFYITTAIDYVNAPPHGGHALEKIQADVLARYHRLLGEDVFFLTGTDENAQKNILAAGEKGIPVKELVDQNTLLFKELAKVLNVSNDDFIRTSDQKRHWPGAKKLWQECDKAGDIYKKSYTGLYCVGCEAFLTDKDLKDGLCPEHTTRPEKISEENYFFRLSRYQEKLRDLILKDEIKIVPETRKNETLSFIEAGLEDLSVSRPTDRMKGWGIPVPGDESQTQYVWLDALANYITALGYGTENRKLFEKYWPADVHVIGKGILRFHAVYWIAFLLSAGLELPKTIFVHGYITVGGQKMSKSLGNVIDPIELVKKYGTDSVRYFLLREFSPFSDGDFTREKFKERCISDLADGLGNLLSRTLTMAEKVFPEGTEYNPDAEFENLFKQISEELEKSMNEFRFNDALAAIWKLVSHCDQYIDKKRLWETGDEQAFKNLLAALMKIALLLRPFLPTTSEEIFDQLRVNPQGRPWRFRIKKGGPLFLRFPFLKHKT